MAENSGISWTDHTFNPYIGCSKVSPACDHCYAERDNNNRFHWVPGWGNEFARKRTSASNWGRMRTLDRKAAKGEVGRRVFCASLADVFDNHPSILPQWRTDLWQLIRETPNLRWILLTKRIGNARKMLPPDWPYPNAGLMATLENQEVWDRDIGKLLDTPAAWHGVSAEPLLGPIDIRGGSAWPDLTRVDWIITGGESGQGCRPLDMNWVRGLRDQCATAGITFHHKQNGGVWAKKAGCLIDGVEHKHFPPALMAA